MNRDDILDLLDRLWEHFDRTADIDGDGTPNASLEFCASLDAAKAALEKERNQRDHLLGAVWDVCTAYEAYRVRNGEDRDSSDVIANAREIMTEMRGDK